MQQTVDRAVFVSHVTEDRVVAGWLQDQKRRDRRDDRGEDRPHDLAGNVERAQRELAPLLANRVTAISGIDLRLLDLVPLVRNAIAHRSPGSSAAMNSALRPVEAALKRGQKEISVSGIGAYLHARSSGGVRRVVIYHSRLRDVAQKFHEPGLPAAGGG